MKNREGARAFGGGAGRWRVGGWRPPGVTKMGCHGDKESRGGHGVVGEALWWRGEGSRRLAMEAKWCQRHREVYGGN